MTEPVQRILLHRALDGQQPATPEDIMTWLEDTANGWNADPTPSSGVAIAAPVANAPITVTIRWLAPVPVHTGPFEAAQVRSKTPAPCQMTH